MLLQLEMNTDLLVCSLHTGKERLGPRDVLSGLVSALAILYGQPNIVRTTEYCTDDRILFGRRIVAGRRHNICWAGGGFYTILLPHILLSTVLLILHFLLILCRACVISTPDFLPKYLKQSESPVTHGPNYIPEIPAIWHISTESSCSVHGKLIFGEWNFYFN